MKPDELSTEIAAVASRLDERLAITERLAREVMGWHVESPDADEWLTPDGKVAASRSWHPLLDIEAALAVVRRLNDLHGWRFTLMQDWHGNWMASIFHRAERIVDSAYSPPDNLPDATCDAAVKALDLAHSRAMRRSLSR